MFRSKSAMFIPYFDINHSECSVVLFPFCVCFLFGNSIGGCGGCDKRNLSIVLSVFAISFAIPRRESYFCCIASYHSHAKFLLCSRALYAAEEDMPADVQDFCTLPVSRSVVRNGVFQSALMVYAGPARRKRKNEKK